MALPAREQLGDGLVARDAAGGGRPSRPSAYPFWVPSAFTQTMNAFTGLDDPDLAGDERLAAVVDEIRTYATGPAPEVRPALMAVLTHGLAQHPGPVGAAPAPTSGRRRHIGRLQTARARLVIGTAAASVGFFATGAAGALPAPAQSAFLRGVSVVGIELPAPVGTGDGAPGASDATSDETGGAGVRGDVAGDGSTSSRPDGLPAPSGDEPGGRSAGPGETPPAGSGDAENQDDTIDGHTPGATPGARPVPVAARPDPRPEAAGGSPGPAMPGPADVGHGGRPDNVPGWADIDDDEEGEQRPGRPQAGKAPDSSVYRPDAPVPPGRNDSLPR